MNLYVHAYESVNATPGLVVCTELDLRIEVERLRTLHRTSEANGLEKFILDAYEVGKSFSRSGSVYMLVGHDWDGVPLLASAHLPAHFITEMYPKTTRWFHYFGVSLEV